jgi:glucosamine 6-phosphate synthetase-like amidotransferase/phosphosugar isomerase protein
VAVEGGYIQLEIAKARASYFATLEYRHGPFLTNTNTTLFALISTGVQIEREKKVIDELVKPGAKVLAISANTDFQNASWSFTLGREVAPEAVDLYAVLITHGLAFYKAVRDGVNPDSPLEGDPPKFIASV